jgi:type IV fimbrial biogenesis protein FimT
MLKFFVIENTVEEMNRQQGFTLNELVITTALITLVTAIGVPSMSNLVQGDRLTSQINSLVSHLALARSQAMTLQTPVTVCASSNQSSCSSGDWSTGWVVFVDTDGDGNFSAGDELLRAREALDGTSELNSSLGARVDFDDRGFSPNSAGRFSLCDERGVEHMKSISISQTGRVRKGGSTSCN